MTNIKLIDLKPTMSNFKEDVIEGLSQPQKSIPPKYLYDEKGSQLFDEICQLQEYYPTRTETQILDHHAPLIDELLPDTCQLLEYGSGSSKKIHKLLQNTKKIKRYVPLDISKEHLQASAQKVSASYPKLDVEAVCADYTSSELLGLSNDEAMPLVVFFPGSTIGNLLPEDAMDLLSKTRDLIGEEGLFILGIDLIKDETTLKRAYNDSDGVTAKFNLNLLTRLNEELNADFDLNNYEHRAIFSPQKKRIEMHLVSTKDHDINVAGERFTLKKDETIHTENSHKFTVEGFLKMAQQADLNAAKVLKDSQETFAVVVLRAA